MHLKLLFPKNLISCSLPYFIMMLTKVNSSRLLKIILVLIILIKTSISFAQVYGCKDPMANNYNSLATINDGSCTYNITSYTPPILVDPINATLVESSGLQMAGNFLWSFNDGGGAAAIYRIDTLSNIMLQTVNLSGATNVDWEDIAFDGTYFYVGDFGNNANGARIDLKIYKFPLSAIPDYVSNPTVTISSGQIEVINFTYSDQPTPIVPATLNNTKYDCEAMIVDGGAIHLFTKNWIDLTSTHYVINSLSAGTYIATPLDTLNTGYLVTAADKAVGQEIIALLGYQNSGLGSHFIHLLTDYSIGRSFNGNKRKINLPDASVMGQAEGITFRNGTYGYISNEKFVRTVGPVTVTVNQKLRSFNTSSFIPVYVLPVELKNFNVTNADDMHKISWQFYDAVQKLDVEYSTDGINFTVIKSINSSTRDVVYYKPLNSANYYRLMWYQSNGDAHYSNIISIKKNEEYAISNFFIKRNGELTFTLNSNSTDVYLFKLVSLDGKILSSINGRYYNPGVNKISIFQNLISDSYIYLNIYSSHLQKT